MKWPIRKRKVIVTPTNECIIAMIIIRVAFQNTWGENKSNKSMKVGKTRWEPVSLSLTPLKMQIVSSAK